MASPFADFTSVVSAHAPRTDVVLGSGLIGVTADFRPQTSIAFADVPGLVPPTIHGHGGRLAVGAWGGVPALVFFGRIHFYEGQSWEAVTAPIRIAADLGVQRLLLTNAAGGIHPALDAGSLMAIRGHIALLGPDSWRGLPASLDPAGRPPNPYSERLIRAVQDHESAASRELVAGVYAALTGPCYETPAEIRALAAMGADAVGMSTAKEAEAAAERGLEVAALSCITNRAAGLADRPLDTPKFWRTQTGPWGDWES